MTARRSTSRKQFDASGQTQPSSTVFFIDRCLGNHDVPQALRNAGMLVEIHSDHFDQDTADAVWIKEVGKRGWAIITKDRQVTSRQIEVVALLHSGQPTFVLTSRNVTSTENIKSILAAKDEMLGCIRTITPPFVATISAAGALSVILTQAQLMQKSTDPPPH